MQLVKQVSNSLTISFVFVFQTAVRVELWNVVCSRYCDTGPSISKIHTESFWNPSIFSNPNTLQKCSWYFVVSWAWHKFMTQGSMAHPPSVHTVKKNWKWMVNSYPTGVVTLTATNTCLMSPKSAWTVTKPTKLKEGNSPQYAVVAINRWMDNSTQIQQVTANRVSKLEVTQLATSMQQIKVKVKDSFIAPMAWAKVSLIRICHYALSFLQSHSG